MVKKIITSRNIRQKVYEVLRDLIAGPEIPPGNKINEDDLARQLGVSKTPVREALSKLAHDGIVEIKPNRGAYKIRLSREDILEIMIIRETLEGLCIRLAVPHADERAVRRLKRILDDMELRYSEGDFESFLRAHHEFHALLHQTARSPRLIRIIQSMYDLIDMVRVQYFSQPDNVSRSLAFHRELINAMGKGEAESAERIRKDMLRATYRWLIELGKKKGIPYSNSLAEFS